MDSWVKIRRGLHRDPVVMSIAEDLGISPWELVGHLVSFWGWVDEHLKPDGTIRLAKVEHVDAAAELPGLGAALEAAGWLVADEGRLLIPKHDRFMAEPACVRDSEREKARERMRRLRDVRKGLEGGSLCSPNRLNGKGRTFSERSPNE